VISGNSRYARWTLSASADAIVLDTGSELIEPEALEIWEAEFEDRAEISGFAVRRPSDDLPGINFSRFPMDLAVVARGTSSGDLSLSFAGILLGRQLLDIPSPVPAQIVTDQHWFLIDSHIVAETAEILAAKGISVAERINIGQLVWLRGRDRLPVPFTDLTVDTVAPGSNLPEPGIIGLRPGTELFSYQETGVSFLAVVARESLGCILADEMGLGKTLQIIALLSIEKAAARGPNLIVCPATLLENWRREIETFAPHLSTLIHAGPMRTGNPAIFASYDVVVTSYETAVRDEPLLSSAEWNVLALDEAQNIRNSDAQRTVAVKGLPRRVSLAVTGTPVENKLTDLWSIADFALPGLLGSREDFEAVYDDSHEDASRLAPVVAPILLRRRVAEVAMDLPPRINVPQVLSMTRQMAALYEDIRREIADAYGTSATLVALGKLRQFCAHPRLLGLPWEDPARGMPKYQRLVEILEEIFARGQKALIFSSFTGMTDILLEDIPERFPSAWSGFIDGRVPVKDRQILVDRFSRHEGFGFLALNPKAAGAGLNITAANHVIHYNPEWNPAVEDQASARAYRRKQKLPVTVHHLYFADSVEEVVADRLDTKRMIADSVVIGHRGTSDASDIARALKISPLVNLESLE
jgi:SNF2 family DNA or RNA helicase